MNALLKKDVLFRWDDNIIRYFEDIKEAINMVLVLVSSDYSWDFIIFSFASEDTIVGVLLQKNKYDCEQPIAFMRKTLRDVEVKYSIIKKQAYSLVKYLKHFRSYVGYNKIKSYFPYLIIKDVLSQQDFLGIRWKWVSNI
jgi:hypothetical protein